MIYAKTKMKNTTRFDNLSLGELFRRGDMICLKIETVGGVEDTIDGCVDWQYNAVDIANGILYEVPNFEEVERVKYKLEISE